MELVPIISIILLYTTGFLFVVIIISGIARKVFVVKVEKQPQPTPSKVVTKIKKKHKSNRSDRELQKDKSTKVPDVRNKYRLTSVGEEYKRSERKRRTEKTRENREEPSKNNKRFIVLNNNLQNSNSFYIHRVNVVNPNENKINYGQD